MAHAFLFRSMSYFPCPLSDKHFRVGNRNHYHYGRIIFVVRPFEYLIGRRFSIIQLWSRSEIQSLSKMMMVTYCRNCICFQRGFYVPRDAFYIQFYFTMSVFVIRGYCFRFLLRWLSLLMNSVSCCHLPRSCR